MKHSSIFKKLFLKKLTLKNFVYRFLSVFAFVSLCTYAVTDVFYTEKTFYQGVHFTIFCICLFFLTLLLFFIQNEKTIRILFLISSSIYLIIGSVYVKDTFMSFGFCLLICMAIFYTETDDLPFTFQNKYILICVSSLLAIAFILHTSVTAALHYLNFGSPCFDFGIFSQMYYSMQTTGKAVTTCERDMVLHHFAVHFSPIYYVLLPFYMLFPTPITLLVAQSVLIASGIIPILLLCKHFQFTDLQSLCFAIGFLFFPAFSGACTYYFHENCFLVPLLLWFLYFMERENKIGSILLAICLLCVKEDAAVYVAVISLYFLVCKKQIKPSLCIFSLSILSFIVITQCMEVFGQGIMSDSRYGDYIYDDKGLFSVIKSVIQNPFFALKHIFSEEKIKFLLQMLLPFCFLPCCIRKPTKLILWIPFVLLHLMTNYPYQYDIHFQYIFGTGAILQYLAIANFADFKHKKEIPKVLLCMALSSVLMWSTGEMSRWNYVQQFKNESSIRGNIKEAISLVPKDASVSASTFFIANMSQRDKLYELEKTKQETDYVVLDLRPHKDVIAKEKFENNSFEEIYFEEHQVAVYKRIQ